MPVNIVIKLFFAHLTVLQVCHTVAAVTNDEFAHDFYNVGLRCQEEGDLECAIQNYQKAIAESFDFAESHLHLGYLLEQTGNLQASSIHYKEAALWSLDKHVRSTALTYVAMAEIRDSASPVAYKRCLRILKKAYEIDDSNQQALLNLGYIYMDLHEYVLAREMFLLIITKNPQHILAHLNVGNFHFHRGEFHQAVDWYNRTVAVSQSSAEAQVMALNNMGSSYRQLGEVDFALRAHSEAFSHTGVYNALRSSLVTANSLPRRSTGQDLFSSIDVTSYDAWTVSNLLTVMGLVCHWQNLELLETLMVHVVSGLAGWGKEEGSGAGARFDSSEIDSYGYMLNRFAPVDTDKYLALFNCRFFSPSLDHFERLLLNMTNRFKDLPPAPRRTRPLRVGYLSYDWKDHPMGRLTSRFVTHHNSSRVLSVSFSYGPPDKSAMRRRVESRSPLFVDLGDVSVAAVAAEVIGSYDLDVLVDLTVLTYNSRLDIPALKPAPIVINYLGFPGPSGCSAFDYVLVDPVSVPPEICLSFSEKLIYMPTGSRGHLRRVYQGNDMPLHVPTTCKSCVIHLRENGSCPDELCRITLLRDESRSDGIKSVDKIYDQNGAEYLALCSFNANKKLDPLSFQVWMNVLRRVPQAILVLLTGGLPSERRLLAEAAAAGIHVDRIVFLNKADWESHLQRATGCDIVLDTFVYGAHTTAADMLWQSVPTVAISEWGSGHGRMPSRVAASLLKSLGGSAPLLVVYSSTEYEDLAVRLCQSPIIRKSVRVSLSSRTLLADTFNKITLQSSLEGAYELAIESLRVVQPLDSLRQREFPSLPHIIGSAPGLKSAEASALESEMLEHGLELLKKLVLRFKGSVQVTYDDSESLVGDSDDPAFSDMYGSIEAIRRRLLASMSEKDVSRLKLCHIIFFDDRNKIDHCEWQSSKPDKNSDIDSYRLAGEKDDHDKLECESFQMMDIFSCPIVSSGRTSGATVNCIEGNLSVDVDALSRFVSCLNDPFRTAEEMQKFKLYQSELLKRGMWQYVNASFHVLAPHLFGQVHDWNFLRGSAAEDRYSRSELLNIIPSRFLGTDSGGSSADQSIRGFVPLDHLMFREEQYSDFSIILRNQGACLSALHRNSEAVGFVISAVLLYCDNNVLLELGSLLGDINHSNAGFDLSLLAVHRMHSSRRLQSQGSDIRSQTQSQHLDTLGMGSRKAPIRIAFYCDEYGQSWWHGWNRSHVDNGGLGGSEEAVLFLAEAIAAISNPLDREYVVEVYLETYNASSGDRNHLNGVHYLGISDFDSDHPPDIFVAWRYVVSLGVLKDWNKSNIDLSQKPFRLLWLHDILPEGVLPTESTVRKYIHQILVPSEFHKNQISSSIGDIVTVVPHGLDTRYVVAESEYFQFELNRNDVFVYASSPYRGLEIVLENWPTIKKAVPTAELNIYYGFTESVERELVGLVGKANYDRWREKMKQLMLVEGVVYHGMVDHSTLSIGMARAGFILYPTHFPETGCLAVIKAMAMGCIPVTSLYSTSALPNLTKTFEKGPKHNPLTPDIASDPHLLKQWGTLWATSVVNAAHWAKMNPRAASVLRSTMRMETRNVYAWRNSAKQFVNLFFAK